jgi:energy-coupling factor transporter ATP-binding protein EcfA2
MERMGGLSGMIKAISVKGYQSLYDISLEMGRFTVIYGESDVGKSALYRAIRGLLTTESGDSFISRGEKSSSVHITMNSGDKIAWVKRRGQSSEYVLNGKISRRSKRVPEEIAKVLRITPIVVDGDTFYPNLRGQFDSLFLLFDSSLKRARVLGSLISNVLLTGIRQVNLERNRNEADIRAAGDLKRSLEERLNQNWDGLLTETNSLKETLIVTRKILDRIEEIETVIGEIESLKPYEKLVYSLLSQKDLTSLADLFVMWKEVVEVQVEVEDVLKAINMNDWLMGQTQVEQAKIRVLLDEMKEKLTITCPNCQHPISLMEVGIE